ncbi:hypothetical protein WBP07_09755 [Novosphingobium sp. BL-8A]|uniref:hypothetical protein n=1 Tax=Novosphingobium sp. BL-8A TaxID=3127639 RepID=UPI0037568197
MPSGTERSFIFTPLGEEAALHSALTLLLSVATLATAGAAEAADLFPACTAPFEHLFSENAFKTHPVSVPVYMRTPPDVRAGRAHLYRTVISSDAAAGANFAGHYTISSAGCGTRTACIAFIDQRSGKVHFPAEMLEASRLWADIGDRDYAALHYRRNSNLLVLVGSANENSDREGISIISGRTIGFG